MSDSESGNGETGTRLGKLANVALHPYSAATSKPAQRAYIGTALAAFGAFVLLCTSSVAYVLFYYNYVPNIGAEHVLHLQFGDAHPYGTLYLPDTLISQQPYDISLSLHLPRTPANLAVGNFMIDMALLTPTTPLLPLDDLLSSAAGSGDPAFVGSVTRARRTAILTHMSMLVETSHLVANMLWFVIGWKGESERLDVRMFEAVSFARGQKNVPDRVQVAIAARETMQIYDARVRVRAEFRGLRWVMYNHRILSFLFFTGAFFSVACSAALGAYFVFSSTSGTEAPPPPEQKTIKAEDDSDAVARDPLSTAALSDTPRSFPGVGRREGLAFAGRGSPAAEGWIKKEEEEEMERAAGILPLTGEADDEDDDETWRDSGIGTGRDSERRRAEPRRRKSSRDEGFR